MSDDNVVQFNIDTLFYIKNGSMEIAGVGDSVGAIEFINAGDGMVGVYSEGDGTIERIKLKHLCIAWLALNYPESLAVDEEG